MEMQPEYIYSATLKKVVDGDTVQAVVDLGFSTTRTETFRFARINAPEKNTPEGIEAKKYVESAFTLSKGKMLLKSHGKDKYGRWLATIYLNIEQVEGGWIELNQNMLDNGKAALYS